MIFRHRKKTTRRPTQPSDAESSHDSWTKLDLGHSFLVASPLLKFLGDHANDCTCDQGSFVRAWENMGGAVHNLPFFWLFYWPACHHGIADPSSLLHCLGTPISLLVAEELLRCQPIAGRGHFHIYFASSCTFLFSSPLPRSHRVAAATSRTSCFHRGYSWLDDRSTPYNTNWPILVTDFHEKPQVSSFTFRRQMMPSSLFIFLYFVL